jgi:hypothetical protein
MAAAQWAGAMLVKGWSRRLTFCAPPIASLYAAALVA